MEPSELRHQLPAVKDRVYLNTGTSGPVPVSSFHAQVDLLRRFTDEGYSSPPVAQAYMAALQNARQAVANMLNASVDEIVLTQSTTDGIGIVAAGVSFEEGDEVIISDLEHISGIAPWAHLAANRGVRVKTVESEDGYLTADRVIEALSPQTKLICISHVSWSTGSILPLQHICRAAREAGVLTLIDGAQSVGHMPVDVEEMGCDFYSLPGQKWLLGPEGTGALYVKASSLEAVAPTRIGWPSLASFDTSEGVHFHPDVRRFETGTVHAPAYAGLAHSISLLEAIGWDEIRRHALHLSHVAREKLSRISSVRMLSPEQSASGLLTFEVEGIDGERCVKWLWHHHRVIIRTIPDLTALRASFHIFNTEDDVDRLVSAVAQYVSEM